MEIRDSFYSVDGHVNWYSHYGKQYGGFLKKNKLKIELPYNPAVPFLGMYREKNMIWKDTCTLNVHHCTVYKSQDMEAA